MAMLLDWVKGTPGLARFDPELAKVLDTAMVVKAQNVSDYLYRLSDKEDWFNKDFPNVAPPAPVIWLEWSMPRTMRSRGRTVKIESELADRRMGVAIREFRHRSIPETAGARWTLRADLFIEKTELGPGGWAGACLWAVSPNGALMDLLPGKKGYLPPPGLPEKHQESWKGWMHTAMFVPWLTISFMHCQNVRVEKGPPQPERLQRKRVRRGKKPLVRWHTVIIDKVGHSQVRNGSSLPGGTKALHISRGHFKNFDKKPLFGKHRGTYWWPMQVRGSASEGVVLKDYDVRGGEAGGGG